MSRKHEMSHNACYDYSRCRWNLQPGDIVKFNDRDKGHCFGEVLFVSLELVHVRRFEDGRIFVISTYDMKDWHLSFVDYIRRLPHGVFKVGDRVFLDGVLNLPDEKYIIQKFDNNRVKFQYFVKGRSVGFFWVLPGEVWKFPQYME